MAPCPPSPVLSVCGSVDGDDVDATVLYDELRDVIEPVLDSADSYRDYYDSTYD